MITASMLNTVAAAVASTCANGSLRILDISSVALVTFPLGATPFNAPSLGALTLAAVHTVNAAATGTAASYVLLQSDGVTQIAAGPVSLSSGNAEVRLDSLSTTSGVATTLSSLTLVVAP